MYTCWCACTHVCMNARKNEFTHPRACERTHKCTFIDTSLSQIPKSVQRQYVSSVAPGTLEEIIEAEESTHTSSAPFSSSSSSSHASTPTSSSWLSFLTGGNSQSTGTTSTATGGAAPMNDNVWSQALENLLESIGVDPTSVVIVSSNNHLLRAARERTCRTVAFNPPNQRRVDVSTDAQISVLQV